MEILGLKWTICRGLWDNDPIVYETKYRDFLIEATKKNNKRWEAIIHNVTGAHHDGAGKWYGLAHGGYKTRKIAVMSVIVFSSFMGGDSVSRLAKNLKLYQSEVEQYIRDWI